MVLLIVSVKCGHCIPLARFSSDAVAWNCRIRGRNMCLGVGLEARFKLSEKCAHVWLTDQDGQIILRSLKVHACFHNSLPVNPIIRQLILYILTHHLFEICFSIFIPSVPRTVPPKGCFSFMNFSQVQCVI